MEITGRGLVCIALTDFVPAAVGAFTLTRFAEMRPGPAPACADGTGRT
ncbi:MULTISPECIES: hypothetical protein [Streptomyces]|nr:MULTISPECIES: hypothetical protein [Streptomyces]MBK3520645.1 hypothetical protein [Streptomyces sp. MBT70]